MTEALEVPALGDEPAYRQTVSEAVAAAAAYYSDGSTALDDDAYDQPVLRIAAYEDAHPDQVAPDSPTGKVAGGAVSGDVPRTVPMLSLDNVFSATEFAAWADGLERRLDRPCGSGAWSRNSTAWRSPPATGTGDWPSSSSAVTALPARTAGSLNPARTG